MNFFQVQIVTSYIIFEFMSILIGIFLVFFIKKLLFNLSHCRCTQSHKIKFLVIIIFLEKFSNFDILVLCWLKQLIKFILNSNSLFF